MTVTKFGLLGLLLVGCASAEGPPGNQDIDDNDDDQEQPIPDQPVDDDDDEDQDPPPPSCTNTTVSLLSNGNFDTTPMGMGWVETPILAQYPLVTNAGTIVQSAPNKAWLGGIAQANAEDSMYQEVTIPAGTTALKLTGFFEVRTQELFLPFDFAEITLDSVSDQLLEGVVALDNLDATTAWAPIDFSFATAHAGETVRLRLASSNDSSDITSFYFDSLDLVATVCQ